MQHIQTVQPGNIRLLKLKEHNYPDLFMIQCDFHWLKKGMKASRSRHIARYELRSKSPVTLRPLPHTGNAPPLYDPSSITFGVVAEFVRKTNTKPGDHILVQAQRIAADFKGSLTDDDWMIDQPNMAEQAVFCVDRIDIVGGMSEFKSKSPINGGSNKAFLSHQLKPGEMVMFDDALVRHRVTPISISSSDEELATGFHDIILISYGGCA